MVRKCIYDISKEIPIDLLVYTRKEYEIIEHNKNSFFKEIDVTGTVLYEKGFPGASMSANEIAVSCLILGLIF
mgnify:CR=1 FL=1